MKKKKSIWHNIAQTLLLLASIGVTFSEKIIGVSFPEHTVVNQLAIPISLGAKFLWDRVLYKKDNLGSGMTRVMDVIPNWATGEKGINKNLPSGLSK